jgi:hypothetical protein
MLRKCSRCSAEAELSICLRHLYRGHQTGGARSVQPLFCFAVDVRAIFWPVVTMSRRAISKNVFTARLRVSIGYQMTGRMRKMGNFAPSNRLIREGNISFANAR